jgi:hypothetical protein
MRYERRVGNIATYREILRLCAAYAVSIVHGEGSSIARVSIEK